MRILFAKIASLKYYKGITEIDRPINGGSYVEETGDAHEQYNFTPVFLNDDDKKKCLGFFELKSGKGGLNQLHIEKIDGCELMRHEDKVEDVLVVWCAVSSKNMSRIVGWYKHATVYRTYQTCEFEDDDIQAYNVIADADDCVLIPWQVRGLLKYKVPQARQDGYGFGQSLQWYAAEPEAQEYVKRVVDMIENYDGPNDLYIGEI